MKTILSSRLINVPEGVKVTISARNVTVKGPRGKLSRSFKNFPIDLKVVPGGKAVRAEMWFGDRVNIATIRTVTSHITNMFTGVTKGFKRKMRMVYAHFPISINVEDGGKKVAVRNFLGEKRVREVLMLPGVEVTRAADVKDEITLIGNDVYNVSQSAAQINQIAKVRDKDIRKFLDGVYVSFKGAAKDE